MKKLIINLFFSILILSCQPIEKSNHIVFDNSQFAHFNILSTSVDINEIFEKKISDENQKKKLRIWYKNITKFFFSEKGTQQVDWALDQCGRTMKQTPPLFPDIQPPFFFFATSK